MSSLLGKQIHPKGYFRSRLLFMIMYTMMATKGMTIKNIMLKGEDKSIGLLSLGFGKP